VIERDEIDAKGRELSVSVADVERDYVFGWLLAALFGHSPYGQRLILKGGNAFRKGYFPATRFSADLDFTAPDMVDPHDLLAALNEVCRFIEARTGVRFDRDRNWVRDEQQINNRQTVCKYQLYFTDFYGNKGHVPTSFRMDVTEFGRLYLPVQTRRLIDPYSDLTDCATDIRVVALEEALTDKLKCLLQRRSSFDLFDLVYSIFVNNDIAVDRLAVVTTFLKKTIFQASPSAALNLLLGVPFDVMRH
jgi:predicted nucleotidyltransferase component of viral defense system